jgi:hypothetical protein
MTKESNEEVPWQVRQGDVFIERAQAGDRCPAGQDVAREQGAIVLAYGESSGHRHQLRAKGSKLFERGSARMLEITAKGGAIIDVATDRGEKMPRPRHDEIPIGNGTFEVIKQREWTADEERQVAD